MRVLVLAGNYDQAKEYAWQRNWAPHEWVYLHEPEQLYGWLGVDVHVYGTWRERKDIESITRLAYERECRLLPATA